MRNCPTCDSAHVRGSIAREAIPVLQNVVYATESEAKAAPRGSFRLATCSSCGLSYNAEFDAALITYDESYDNHVSSDVFKQYYRDLGSMLAKRLGLRDGPVYEIGCGNGEFLKTLCKIAPGVHAIGIDPSCSPEKTNNYQLIRSQFDREVCHIAGSARLILLRHVLEHIEQPVQFLKEVMAANSDAPLYVEVPDLSWILRNCAFWDFCYEHCNYFTPEALKSTLAQAGLQAIDEGVSFGGQYQWVICRASSSPSAALEDVDTGYPEVERYAEQEEALMRGMTRKAKARDGLVLWGMATKGVMLSNVLPEGSVLGGVDMNAAKQGKFCSLRGTAIHSPNWMAGLPEGTVITVMNPNYLAEIQQLSQRYAPQVVLEVA